MTLLILVFALPLLDPVIVTSFDAPLVRYTHCWRFNHVRFQNFEISVGKMACLVCYCCIIFVIMKYLVQLMFFFFFFFTYILEIFLIHKVLVHAICLSFDMQAWLLAWSTYPSLPSKEEYQHWGLPGLSPEQLSPSTAAVLSKLSRLCGINVGLGSNNRPHY